MMIQGYPVICNGIHYQGRYLKPICKRCELYTKAKQLPDKCIKALDRFADKYIDEPEKDK